MKGIADLLDSDMEDSTNFIDENSILSSASDASAGTATKGKRAKKRHRVTMPAKSRSKVQKAAPAPAKKAATKQTAAKRKALEEQINNRDVELAQNQDEAQEDAEEQVVKPKKPSRAPAKPRANKKAAALRETEDDVMEIDQTPAVARSNNATSRSQGEVAKVAPKGKAASKPKPADSTHTAIADAKNGATPMQEEGHSDTAVIEPVAQPKTQPRNASRSRQEPPYRRRAGSASDTERGDPNLRRKLGDMTRKFENVDLKYRNLKEVGINEANANMEKLRRQCDATVHASNELIASLKKELAAQAPQAQEARKLKKQMQSQETEATKLRETATELAQSLNHAQNEIKALQAKLAAARASSVDHTTTKVPGSAIKGPTQRAAGPAAAEAAQIAQMKEDLYSDLTGLIIRGVKKTEEGDTYDCIQTGRNGTLHFKLYVDSEDAKSTSFEETEFLYTPLLDTNRDRDMIDLMPSYLTEDITFARQNAAKFYGRVVDTLTKRKVEE